MTPPAWRRLLVPLLSALSLAFAFVLVPTSPASAALVTQGISGHVTGPNGAGLEGIEVAFFIDVGDGDFAYDTSIGTDALGNYSMTLPAASWKVAFTDSANGDYITEYYDNAADLEDATVVDVTASHVSTSVNGQLAAGGHLTGDAAGGTGGWVGAWSESTPGAGDWQLQYGADVQPDGSFDIGGLPTATYRIGFQVDNFAPEFWKDKPDLASATPVTVTAPNTVSGIDPTLTPDGHVTGHVQTVGGAPLADALVDAYVLQGSQWVESDDVSTSTDDNGDYDLAAPPGTYRLEFSADGYADEFYDDVSTVDAATSLQVGSQQTVSGIDATLALDGHVTGHLQAADGTPLADAFVEAYVLQGSQWVESDDIWTSTDDQGDYDLAAPAGTYRLEFSADGYASEFYDDVHAVEDAADVKVTSGSVVSGTDAVLDAGASISGQVTFPAGADPNGDDGVVTAYDTSDGQVAAMTWVDTEAGSGNTYPFTLDGLAAGTYRVEFAGEDGSATSEAEYYDNHPESDGPASATAVTLTAGQQRTGVDATLRAGGTISGTLVDGNDKPLADCEVVAFNNVNHFAARVGTTGADGSFVVTGLTTGQYGVLVGDPYGDGSGCATTEYYTDSNGDLSPSSTGIVPVSAAPGSDTALPHQLVYGGSVDTQPVANVTPPSVPTAAPVVGTPVTANPGTWNPSGATFRYQWRANGSLIAGATAASYTPVAGDVGKSLSVTVTASSDGYSDASKDSNGTAFVTAASQGSAIANTSAPSVAGVPRVGLQLSANPGTWSAQTGTPTVALQWLRNGVPVPGATTSTYALGADDLAARISLRVTATEDGYQPSQVTTAPTDPVAAGILTLTDVPRMLGRLKVGRVLTAVAPSCVPAATDVRYQWLRNGVAIKGARAKQPRYGLVRADRRKRISVRITVLRPGYAPTVSVARKAGRVK